MSSVSVSSTLPMPIHKRYFVIKMVAEESLVSFIITLVNSENENV